MVGQNSFRTPEMKPWKDGSSCKYQAIVSRGFKMVQDLVHPRNEAEAEHTGFGGPKTTWGREDSGQSEP